MLPRESEDRLLFSPVASVSVYPMPLGVGMDIPSLTLSTVEPLGRHMFDVCDLLFGRLPLNVPRISSALGSERLGAKRSITAGTTGSGIVWINPPLCYAAIRKIADTKPFVNDRARRFFVAEQLG